MSEDVNIELFGVCCQTTFVPMRPAVPYPCNAHNDYCEHCRYMGLHSDEPMCERGRQSRCGSTMVKFRSSNMTGHEQTCFDIGEKRPCGKMM